MSAVIIIILWCFIYLSFYGYIVLAIIIAAVIGAEAAGRQRLVVIRYSSESFNEVCDI